MTNRMVMVLSTALLAAGISFATLRPATAQNDTSRGTADDRTTPPDRPMAGSPTGPGDSPNTGTDTGDRAHANDQLNAKGKMSANGKMNATDQLNANDRAFMMEAVRGSQAEIDLGRLAADHGGSPDVMKFGQQMVTDHTRMNDEVKQLAAQKNATLPQGIDAKLQAMHDRLLQASQRSGVEFDREYMKKMVQDHEQDVALFQREANHGKDADTQSWAQKNLPTIQEHLRMARNISDNLKKNRTAKR